MQKNFLFPTIIVITVVALLAGFVYLIKTKNTPPPDNTMIFFYGDTCPHCLKVEEFFVENKTEEKFSFEKREVYNSTINAKLMTDRYKKCGITEPKDMGVPLFWTGTECLQGDVDIINYFETRSEG
jgi:thiol-disulfide isomerase/thioredoxin